MKTSCNVIYRPHQTIIYYVLLVTCMFFLTLMFFFLTLMWLYDKRGKVSVTFIVYILVYIMPQLLDVSDNLNKTCSNKKMLLDYQTTQFRNPWWRANNLQTLLNFISISLEHSYSSSAKSETKTHCHGNKSLHYLIINLIYVVGKT